MVPCMYQFVCHCVFLMTLIPEFIRTEQDAMIDVETARLFSCTHTAVDVTAVHIGAELGDFVAHKADNGT